MCHTALLPPSLCFTQFTDKDDGLATKQERMEQPEVRSLWLQPELTCLLHNGWVTHRQVVLQGEEKIKVGRDAINPNNSSAAPGTHRHTEHIPLQAIIQHTLHNCNLCLCEIDFWGARLHEHPLSSLKAGPAQGTGTHCSRQAPPPDQHILCLCQGRLLKRLRRWIRHCTLVMQ